MLLRVFQETCSRLIIETDSDYCQETSRAVGIVIEPVFLLSGDNIFHAHVYLTNCSVLCVLIAAVWLTVLMQFSLSAVISQHSHVSAKDTLCICAMNLESMPTCV